MSEVRRTTREFDIAGAVFTLVRTDFLVRYHRTFMGLVWALLKPLAILGVLLSVFSYIFAETPDYAVRLVIGLFLYDYFQEATKTGLASLHMKGFLLTRSRFPRWILVVTSTANPLITLVVASSGIFAFLAASGRAPSPGVAGLYALYVVHLVAIAIGVSLALSVLFVRYRDLNQVWDVVTQAGFFVAPVIYPLEILPERFHFYLYLWPPTSVIQFSRAVLGEREVPTLRAHLLLALMAASILGAGIAIHRRLVPRTAENL